MNDTTLTDMTPFLQRHDYSSRRVFFALVSASLAASAVILLYGLRVKGSAEALGKLWFPIVAYPVFLAVFWTGTALWSRTRPKPPGGRYLMTEDDARNIARVAHAGMVFVVGLGMLMIVSQIGIALNFFDGLNTAFGTSDWSRRAVLVALGALAIYFGNMWPRMPTPRAAHAKPATQTRYKRLGGWFAVVTGLLLALPALFLPTPAMIYAIAIVSIVTVAVGIVFIVMYCIAMRSPNAS